MTEDQSLVSKADGSKLFQKMRDALDGGRKLTYAEKLLDPKWKEKRLQIIRRDGGVCLLCKSKTRLEVHHAYYISKRDLWDYPEDSFLTLCHDCHTSATNRYSGEFALFEIAACAVLKAIRTNR